jgi:hypothetical protein
MINDLVIKAMLKFKQPANKEKENLYRDLITEEYKELQEATTVKEKVKETIDLIWMCIGYLYCIFKGNTLGILKAYKSVSISNMSKVCLTEKDALKTQEYYLNRENSKETKIVKYEDDDGDYWVVYDMKDKYVKGINYKPTNLDWMDNN